jgi:anti-anti-sigma factor
MDIIETKNEHGAVLSVNRSLDRTNSRDLDKALQTIFDKEKGAIWLDVSGLQSLDSAGLSMFLKWHRKSLAQERRFALVRANAFHQKLLQITRLDQELVVYDEPGGRRVVRGRGGRFEQYEQRPLVELVEVG